MVSAMVMFAILDNIQARLALLPALCTSGRLQSATEEELDALMPAAEGATIGRGVEKKAVSFPSDIQITCFVAKDLV